MSVVHLPRVAANPNLITATLRISHLTDRRDQLSLMLKALHDMSDKEPDSSLQMALELAALEIGRLADRFNTELTRTSFNLSLALEDEK